MSALETDVLITGGGPSGLMMALLLQRLGVNALVAERNDSLRAAPAAHVVNARTLEICRAAGVDMAALEAAAQDPLDAAEVHWVTKLGAEPLGRLPYERQGDDQLAFTPTPLRNISQNRFEPILLEALEASGASPCLWGHAWKSSREDGGHLISQLDGPAGPVAVRSRFVVGADGAGSPVRRALGIEMVGPDRIQCFLTIHLRADLRAAFPAPLSAPSSADSDDHNTLGVLNFVVDPVDGGGAFVVHDRDSEAVYMHPYDPDVDPLESFTKERCDAIVRGAIEDPNLDFEIETLSSWSMTAQVAESYHRGRTFLIGDAAHRFPPTGGLGLNTGVQDAHNLAWKLAAVVKGRAGEGLLNTYNDERRPVAQANADQSLENALRLFEVPIALGITDESEDSRRQMQATLKDSEGRRRVSAAIALQAEHFDLPGMQLGFCYAAGFIAASDETAELPQSGNRESIAALIDPPASDASHFRPSGRAGSRLPHVFLNDEDSGGEQHSRRSVLDLVPLDSFLLLAGPDGAVWQQALDALSLKAPSLKAPSLKVECLPILTHTLSRQECPDLDRWLAECGIAANGALLLRPDQHVAWRARSAGRLSAGKRADAKRRLQDALTSLSMI